MDKEKAARDQHGFSLMGTNSPRFAAGRFISYDPRSSAQSVVPFCLVRENPWLRDFPGVGWSSALALHVGAVGESGFSRSGKKAKQPRMNAGQEMKLCAKKAGFIPQRKSVLIRENPWLRDFPGVGWSSALALHVGAVGERL
jgi:hypothetical protein